MWLWLALAGGGTPAALAMKAIPPPPPLQVAVRGTAQVAAEAVDLDCRALPDEACRVTLTITVQCAPTGTSETCQVTADMPPGFDLDPAQPRGGRVQRDQKRAYLQLPLGKHALVVSGDVATSRLYPRLIDIYPAARHRHVALSNYDLPKPISLTLLLAERAQRTADYQRQVRLRLPPGWTSDRLDNASSDTAEREVRLSARPPEPSGPWLGGPFIALGADMDMDQFRARFGFEFAAPTWLMYGVAVDTNFVDDVVITPSLEAVSPVLSLLPISVSIGIGMPVRVTERPQREVGVRVQGAVTFFYVVGTEVTFDYYPQRDAGELTLAALFTF